MEYGMLRQFATARVARSSFVFATNSVMAISYVDKIFLFEYKIASPI
jgi:hypothetical protein